MILPCEYLQLSAFGDSFEDLLNGFASDVDIPESNDIDLVRFGAMVLPKSKKHN